MRLLFIYLATLFQVVFPFVAHAQDSKAGSGSPKVALVLCGGGARGLTHIGVLKVLEEEGIPVDIIVGTSMGALVGGAYAIGYNAAELETLVKSLDWETTLSDGVPRTFLSKNDQLLNQRYLLSLPVAEKRGFELPQSLVKGQNVLNLFCGLTGEVPVDADFTRFPVSFACVAADLESGEEVVMNKGFLPTALYSSMAIPLAFQSSERDGHLLVDGGLVNNFPIDVAKQMGADIIIGVDIRNDFHDRENLKSMDNVLEQLVSFFDHGKDSVNNRLCDLIIRPDITGYSVSSFSARAVDTLLVRGEKATLAVRDQIRAIKSAYHLEPRPKSRHLVPPEQWHITGIRFSGDSPLDDYFLQKRMGMEFPGDFSAQEIKTAIDRLYGMGGFERIYYNLVDQANGKLLNLNIETRQVLTYNVGFKANTTDAAAIMINTTRKNYGNRFGLFSASAELSVNPGLSLMAESNKTNLPAVGISLEGKYQNYNVFDRGDKLFKANVFYTSAALYIYQPFLKKYNLGLGFQEEYFAGDIFSRNGIMPLTPDKIDCFLSGAYAYLSYDNMDDYYFPKKGSSVYTEFSLMKDFQNMEEICPVALFRMKNVIPAGRKTALLLDFYGRGLFNADYPLTRMTLIGGEPYSQYFNYHLPFVGLPSVNVGDQFSYIGSVGLRLNVAPSQYVSLIWNGLWQDSDWLFREGAESVYGGGIKYSMKTMLGPLDVTLGYSGATEKMTFSANFGYWF